MMKICDKTVLLCDSSKFHGKSFYKICDFSDIDYLVTDKKPNERILTGLKDYGCEVIWYDTDINVQDLPEIDSSDQYTVS